MANVIRTIVIPAQFRFSGIEAITQKVGSGAVTIHYTDNTTECAIYSKDIGELKDFDEVADMVEFIRSRNIK
jgi:hypothetical protein